MKKLYKNQAFVSVLRFLGYGAQVIALIIILKYTGLASAITSTSNELIMMSGVKNISVDNPAKSVLSEHFDYNFSIKSLDGEVFKMSEFKGKVLFVNLWATWCGPCRTEMPSIQNLYSKLDSTDIQFIMLSIDNPGNEKKVKKYISDRNFTFPVFTPAGYLTEQLTVPSIPTTFVVNKDGKIVVKRVGMTNFDTSKFKSYLEKLAE